MRTLSALATASVLLLGLSTAAVAAPILVTYGILPGGSASYSGCVAGCTGVGGGTFSIVYANGASTTGGSALTPVALGLVQPLFAVPGTAPGGSPGGVPGILVGYNLPIAIPIAGFFAGTTLITPGNIPGLPYTFIGVANSVTIFPAAGGPGVVTIAGNGTQSIRLAPGFTLPFNWTLGRVTGPVVGVEISRVNLPEPGTGLLLLAGLVGLGGLGTLRVRRLRR